jgi:hypothetical protein
MLDVIGVLVQYLKGGAQSIHPKGRRNKGEKNDKIE